MVIGKEFEPIGVTDLEANLILDVFERGTAYWQALNKWMLGAESGQWSDSDITVVRFAGTQNWVPTKRNVFQLSEVRSKAEAMGFVFL